MRTFYMLSPILYRSKYLSDRMWQWQTLQLTTKTTNYKQKKFFYLIKKCNVMIKTSMVSFFFQLFDNFD